MQFETLFLDETQRSFVASVESFIENEYPLKLKEKSQTRAAFQTQDFVLWQQALHKKGWGAPLWPKEYGGPGWNELEKYLFYSTLYKHDVIIQLPFGPSMLAPVVMAFGNKEQKDEYLPKILAGEHIWCQGYSEPNSGSDLASLQMQAVRDGDGYILNGAKIWTTAAQFANWIFCLVRTKNEGKPQEGISFVLVDMSDPGVTVRPIITADKEHEVNQINFDNVRIPLTQLVGQENKGWDCAKYLLTYERSSFGARLSRLECELNALRELLQTSQDSMGLTQLKTECEQLTAEVLAAKFTMLRAVTSTNPGYALKISSIIKILSTRLIQCVSDFHLKVYGSSAMVQGRYCEYDFFNEALRNKSNLMGHRYFNQRKESIYAGSNEIQKNIIAKMILGL